MSGRGKRSKQSWRTKLSNAVVKRTGCSFESHQADDMYRRLIGAKPEDEIYDRVDIATSARIDAWIKTLRSAADDGTRLTAEAANQLADILDATHPASNARLDEV